MVLRRRAGEPGVAEMPLRSREIASVGGDLHCGKPLVTLKPAGRVKQKGPSSCELRLIQKYMHEARPRTEDEVDEAALRKLVKSSTFKKFVLRLELENEVVELHEQLEKEVELHSTLQSALSHASTQLPESILHDLPSNVQRLLTDIAMLEATVLRLETQASALQWDIAHERTERESIELTLNAPKVVPESQSPTLPPRRSTSAEKSPTLATLKELLHTPALLEPDNARQFEFSPPPPKSPVKQNLRSLWSALDGQQQTSFPPILKKLNTKDRARIHQASSPDQTKTCFPSLAVPGAVPFNLHLPATLSPFTPGEPPRTTTPVTPAAAPQPDTSPTRKLLNPARLLVSSKRLAFWNSSSSTADEAASLNNRAANPTPEVELLLPEQHHDCSSILSEDFTDDVRMRKLRRSRGIRKADQSSPTRDSDISPPRKSSFIGESPRRSSYIGESPRPSTAASEKEVISQMLWRTETEEEGLPGDANHVSEEMVRCMVDIYCHLAEPSSDSHPSHQECPQSPSSHTGRLSTSSSLSSSQSDHLLPFGARSPDLNHGQYGDVLGSECTSDPYKAMGKLPWSNIGPYTDAYEVPWLSVSKHQLEYVAHSLGKFRLLVERLAKVDPSVMTHEQKLAFWINLYNALLMHAFLAYGIPRSDLKFFTLMQKAAYCVGGHWFNAAAIECNLLKAKIMLHRPQFALIMALHNKKLTEEQSQYGLDQAEPKVNFALSCGGHSSPMVRIYTPEHIHDELDSAFQDYLRATVGMTAKGRVLLPKLVYNYAREFVDDDAVLEWVCRFLPIQQVTVIYECLQQRQRRRLFQGAPFSVAPYSFAFRYLFPRSIVSGAAALEIEDLSASEKKRYHFCA